MGEVRQADAIRDAATVILIRGGGHAPRILMGQRGAGAVFMPAKFVFPGGAVDPQDHEITPGRPLPAEEVARLGVQSEPKLAHALALAAIRELWEETGLVLGTKAAPIPAQRLPGQTPAAPTPQTLPETPHAEASSGKTSPTKIPDDWAEFHASGYRPDASALRFVYRAITPPGRVRRFDCRFFLADAGALANDPDDFSRASGELDHLAWLSLAEARSLDLPNITRKVLGEVEARLNAPARRASLRSFREGHSSIERI